jgi:hypothetical protein
MPAATLADLFSQIEEHSLVDGVAFGLLAQQLRLTQVGSAKLVERPDLVAENARDSDGSATARAAPPPSRQQCEPLTGRLLK